MGKITAAGEITKQWAESRELPVVFTLQTGSTNDDAKKNALNEAGELVLYLSNHQNSGRGRGANTWLDTGNGEALLSTWSFALTEAPQAITGPRIGLALFRAAHAAWPSLAWGLKAPNDLNLAGQKVAGLLIETVTSGGRFRLLVGLGMNVLNHPRAFKSADHLSQVLNEPPDEGEWFQFLDELRAELDAACLECVRSDLNEAACLGLVQALNANSSKAFSVQRVSPKGDLIHAGGAVRWTEL